MLQIIYGLCGGGKTTLLLKKILEGANKREKQLLIVPETKTFEMEKKVLSMFPHGASPYVEVCSQTRLADRILDDKTAFFVDKGGKALIAKKALRQSASALKYYKKGIEKIEFCQKLVEIFDELHTSGIQSEQLYQLYNKWKKSDNLYDIATVYTVYEEELKKIGTDESHRLNLAAEKVKTSSFFENTTVYFDNFSGFTYGELLFIEEIAKKTEQLYFSLLTDGRDTLFYEQNRTLGKLIRIGEQTGHKVVKNLLTGQYAPEDIRQLAGLYSFEKTAYPKRVEHVRQIVCETIYEECMFVAAEIRRLALTENIRYSQISIACGAVPDYERILQNACYMQDVPFFVADKTKILSKPVMLACIGALKSIEYRFSYESMFSFLKTGLFPIDDALCSRMENYVLAFQIKGNRWNREWTKPAVDYGTQPTARDYQELEQINKARKNIIEPLWRLKDHLTKAAVGKEYVKAFLDYLDEIEFEALLEQKIKQYGSENLYREAQEYGQIYEILLDGAKQFLRISGDDPMTSTEFIQLFSLLLSQYSVAAIPGMVDQVVLSDFRNMPSEHPKIVFLIGCTDAALPPSGGGDSLLSEMERIALKDEAVELSLTSEERQTELESHIYRAFTCACQCLYTTYPQQGKKGEALRPSYLYERIGELFLELQTEQITAMDKQYLLSAPKSIAGLACLGLSGDTSAAAIAAMQYQNSQGKVENGQETGPLPRGPITNRELLKDLYGNQLSLSASRIERFSSCPFSYFMEYGLKAKPRHKIEFDALTIGSFLHELVEKAVKAYVENPNCDIKAQIDQTARAYILRVVGKEPGTARLQVLLNNIVHNAYTIIADIIKELQASAFQPLSCEFTFGKEGDAPPYTFQRGGVSVSVQGKIDRVDGYIKGNRLYLKVVDYKSGQKSFALSDLLYGLNIQMFLYLMMLQETKDLGIGARYEEKAAAAVLYVPLRNEYTPGNFSDETEEKPREGYVLDQLDIINALENAKENRFLYLPVAIKKDGGFSAASTVLSAAEFGKIFKKLQHDLEVLADKLLAGHIEAQPYRRALSQTSCDFCPYHSACQFDETNQNDRMKAIKKLPKEQVLQKMTEEAE